MAITFRELDGDLRGRRPLTFALDEGEDAQHLVEAIGLGNALTGDIPGPPLCPLTDQDHEALQAFEDEVIDRLYAVRTRKTPEKQGKLF